MSAKVIAIGMDAGDPVLLERWMDAGLLPGLAGLRSQGAWGRLVGGDYYRAEAVWTTLLTGCGPERTGYWTALTFEPEAYGVTDRGAYDYAEHPPFYALGDQGRVAAVDVPQARLSPDVNGAAGARLGSALAPGALVLLAAGALRRAGGPARAPPRSQQGPRHLLEPGRGRAAPQSAADRPAAPGGDLHGPAGPRALGPLRHGLQRDPLGRPPPLAPERGDGPPRAARAGRGRVATGVPGGRRGDPGGRRGGGRRRRGGGLLPAGDGVRTAWTCRAWSSCPSSATG